MAGISASPAWTFSLWIAAALSAQACQVPVFRYALERWAPAEYLVTITPASGGLSDADKQAVELLRAAPVDPANPVNLQVQVAAPSANGASATIALHYPDKLRGAEKAPLWEAPLTRENVQRLVDSPVRAELRQRLLAGQSAIWVLVECGDRAKDDAAAAAMAEAIAAAESSLRLPDGVVTPSQAASGTRAKENAEVLRSDLPLEIRFSLLRMRRDDPKEAPLLAMLIHLEQDLADYEKEPMVFPVFGRGRVLEPLIGAGIHKGNVLEHSGYLCGACSCEVKDQNPGIDLLMAANWAPVDTTPQLEIVRITPKAEPPPQRQSANAPVLHKPLVGVAGGAVLLGLAAFVLRRKRNGPA